MSNDEISDETNKKIVDSLGNINIDDYTDLLKHVEGNGVFDEMTGLIAQLQGQLSASGNQESTSQTLRSIYETSIYKLDNAGDNLISKERNYLINEYGEENYYLLLKERYEKLVNDHTNSYNAYFDKVKKNLNDLININEKISSSKKILDDTMELTRSQNKRIKKKLQIVNSEIHTNNRNSYYATEENGKLNAVNRFFLVVYYIIFAYYVYKFIKGDKTKWKIVALITLFILPIVILPALLHILRQAMHYITHLYETGPKNAFLDIHAHHTKDTVEDELMTEYYS